MLLDGAQACAEQVERIARCNQTFEHKDGDDVQVFENRVHRDIRYSWGHHPRFETLIDVKAWLFAVGTPCAVSKSPMETHWDVHHQDSDHRWMFYLHLRRKRPP